MDGAADPRHPPRILIGGGGRDFEEIPPPGRGARKAPTVERSKRMQGYGEILATGFDTIEETFDLELAGQVLEELELAKIEAQDAGDNGLASIRIGGEVYQVKPHGAAGGVKFIFQSEDLLIRIRPRMDWPVSIRYLSAAIWRDGADYLRAKAQALLMALAGVADPPPGGAVEAPRIRESVKRIDFAIDIYSPAFTEEMRWEILQGVVCHSSSKVYPVGTSSKLQTITIGGRKTLQVQVYEKSREITEISGKSWMVDLWTRNPNYQHPGRDQKPEHVWRIECRFAKEYLKERGIRTFEDVRRELHRMVAEALHTHRLADLRGAGAKAQARDLPLHPLWSMAAEKNNCREMPPLGRIYTEKRERLSQMMLYQASGCLRAKAVLDTHEFKPTDAARLAGQIGKRLDRLSEDEAAVDKLLERYRFLDGMQG